MVEISTFTKRVEGELKSFGLALGEAKPCMQILIVTLKMSLTSTSG